MANESTTETTATSESTATESKPAENQHADLDKIEGLGDKGKEAIRREREARAESDRKLTETAKRLQELEQKESDRAEAQRKADETAAAEAGKFEELATKREQERDAAKADVTRLTQELDQYRAAVADQVESGWKGLPKEVQEIFTGADDDPLAKLAFLAKSKPLVEKITGQAAQRGNGVDPKASGAGKPEIKSLISRQQFLG